MASMTERFLDNEWIEVTPGVTRKLQQPKKHPLNPVVRQEQWWEGEIIQPYCTMYDEEDRLFKMWARVGSDAQAGYVDGHAAFTAYLVSTDGVHWQRPSLGVTDISGRRDHNVVFVGHETDTTAVQHRKGVIAPNNYEYQGKKGFIWSVIKHPHPKTELEKFVGLAFLMKRRGAYIVTSPDGTHWSCDEDAPFWQTPHDVSGKGDDALMHLMYDKVKQKWVIYRRIIPEHGKRMIAVESDRYLPRVDRYYRSYAYAESEDLRHWTNHQHILSMNPDDPADTELYQFACHQYGDVYVGFMSVFYLRSPQPLDIQLATSRDGIHFTRVRQGEAFIPAGPFGYYDYMAMACSQPEPVLVDDTVYIYYAACNFAHDVQHYNYKEQGCGAALATFKRDRFVALETSDLDPGPCRVVTKPFVVRHPKLFINATTWGQGSIRVEALTDDWQPVSGFVYSQAGDISGDALDHPVRWEDNADLGPLMGREIRLKFYMTRARLYAMTFSDEDRPLSAVHDGEQRTGHAADSAPEQI